MTTVADPSADLGTVVSSFNAWLEQHGDEMAVLRRRPEGDLVDAVAQVAPGMHALRDGGWMRLGWPKWAGGMGGSPVQRAAVFEALAAADYVVPEVVSTVEIVGPMLVR